MIVFKACFMNSGTQWPDKLEVSFDPASGTDEFKQMLYSTAVRHDPSAAGTHIKAVISGGTNITTDALLAEKVKAGLRGRGRAAGKPTPSEGAAAGAAAGGGAEKL